MILPPPPAHLEPYVAVFGPDEAVRFLLAFGGAELSLSKNPRRSRLAAEFGEDKAAQLAALAEWLDLPRRVPLGKPWIAQVLFAKGLPVMEIARTLHSADKSVRKWIDDAGQPAGQSARDKVKAEARARETARQPRLL